MESELSMLRQYGPSVDEDIMRRYIKFVCFGRYVTLTKTFIDIADLFMIRNKSNITQCGSGGRTTT
jgi:hypothetical protein